MTTELETIGALYAEQEALQARLHEVKQRLSEIAERLYGEHGPDHTYDTGSTLLFINRTKPRKRGGVGYWFAAAHKWQKAALSPVASPVVHVPIQGRVIEATARLDGRAQSGAWEGPPPSYTFTEDDFKPQRVMAPAPDVNTEALEMARALAAGGKPRHGKPDPELWRGRLQSMLGDSKPLPTDLRGRATLGGSIDTAAPGGPDGKRHLPIAKEEKLLQIQEERLEPEALQPADPPEEVAGDDLDEILNAL
jgi:hypothetical protein